MLLWCWFRDGHRLSGVICSLKWALMLIAVPFGEQWSGLESLLLPTEWPVCCSGSVFACEGYSEEVLLDVAWHG